eukprot:415696-Pyramimonas_sp.AAC.1
MSPTAKGTSGKASGTMVRTSPTSLAPLREELDRLRDSGPRLPPIGISGLRRAAESFPVRAAVGADSWRPRHWALASDPAL